MTGTSLVAAARLGSRCAYAGALGNDPLSEYILENFTSEGIDVRHVVTRNPAPPFHSIVIVDTERNTRNIFYDGNGVIGADPDLPLEEVIRSTRVLFVDHVGVAGMIRAIRNAQKAGIPVVADCERPQLPHLEEFLSIPDHLIVSLGFASHVTGKNDAGECARSLGAAEKGGLHPTASTAIAIVKMMRRI